MAGDDGFHDLAHGVFEGDQAVCFWGGVVGFVGLAYGDGGEMFPFVRVVGRLEGGIGDGSEDWGDKVCCFL